MHAQSVVLSRGDGHCCRAIDGDRQDEAAVVVGVFADEVDAPGCFGDELRLAAVLSGEGADEVRGVGGHAVVSIGATPVCNPMAHRI